MLILGVYMPLVVGIAIAREKRAPMEPIEVGVITGSEGLVGNHRGRRNASSEGRRQITVISYEQWLETCAELGIIKPWRTRRANVCVGGKRFGPADVGTRMMTDRGLELEITGETKPCERMDEIHPGLRDALSKDWRGGVTCRVIMGAEISVGDEIF